MKDEDPRRWRPSAEGKRLAQMRMAGFDGKGNTRTSMAMKLPPRGQMNESTASRASSVSNNL